MIRNKVLHMAMGTRRGEEQAGMWVMVSALPRSVSHPFYEKLNRLLAEHGFDDFVEAQCRPFYAEKMGRPSLAPGQYFRLLLLGYFEGLDSERAIAWRAADSLGVRSFLGLALTGAAPDHSTISRTRRLIDLDTHRAVFTWVVQCLGIAGLVKGKPLAIDATTLEANAALRSIVRRDSGESYNEFLTKLAQASGIETPTRADLAKLDRKRKNKGSNKDWTHPHDPDARIAKMKDGRTHLAHKAEHAVEKILQSTRGAFEMFGMYLGLRLGYYRVLGESGPANSQELADRTVTNERYAREWLEQQAICGIVEVDDESIDARSRRYALPEPYREVLADEESVNYLGALPIILAGALHPLHAVVQAYRTGGGVAYGDYGADLIEGQAGMNRAMFLKEMGSSWLPRIPDVHHRLLSDPPARVADVGAGAGWSSIAIARSYPKAQIDGFDLDQPSVEMARRNARLAGIDDRVKFHVRDAADPQLAGQYDLVAAFECIHDMADPVNALRAMKHLAGSTGMVLVVDERVGESFSTKENDVDWMMYGWSILHCLPVGMADKPSAETGTVMRPNTLRIYAREAGFTGVEILPIENYFFRFYRLIP